MLDISRLAACIKFLPKGKASVLFLLMGAVLLAPMAFVAQAAESQVFRLKNGLSVVIREDARFPLVSVRLLVKAGSAWERPEEAGMSHLLEHMVFKGSKTRAEGVDTMVEKAGGYLNASTSYDVTIYETDLPSDKWKTAMTAVRDLAFDPLMRQADLDAEREVVLAEKKQRGDSPYTRLFHALLGKAFKGTPYEKPVIGTEEALRAATPETIRAYIQRRYDPRDMVLCVAGNVNKSEILQEAEELFGAYPNRNSEEVQRVLLPADLAHGLQVEVIKGPWNKVFLGVVFPLPGVGHARRAAVDVLAQMLGGDDTALLPRKLRIENPLADMVMASPMFYQRLGGFLVVAQLDADKVDPYLATLADILGHLQVSQFTEQEFMRAKLNLENSFLRGQETIADMADFAGNLYYYSPADPDGDAYLQSIRDVSREQVQSVIRDWLRPDAMTVAALVPQDSKITKKTTQSALEAWPGAGEAIKKAAELEKLEKRGKRDRLEPPKPTQLAKPEIMNLGGGRTLVLLPDASLPYVSASLMFSGGDLMQDVLPGMLAKDGLAEFSAQMLTSATQSKHYADMNAFLADRAASLSASASGLHFVISLESPTRFGKDMFALLREVLEEPAFGADDQDRVKRDMQASLASKNESAMGVLSQNLTSFLYPDSVYGRHTSGTAETIAGMTRVDAAAFWTAQYQQPWVLAVSGDFDRKNVIAFAKSLPEPSAKRLLGAEPAWNTERTLALTLPGRDQAVYMMLFPTEGFSGKNSAALRLLASSLDGFGGMLFQELREKRSLGYSVSPMNWAGEHTGFLAFSIVAAPENLEQARQEFAKIARRLQQEPLPVETLDRAKAMLEASHYRSQQRISARSTNAARQMLFNRPIDYPLQRLNEMLKLTPADIQQAAQFLNPDKAYSLTVKP